MASIIGLALVEWVFHHRRTEWKPPAQRYLMMFPRLRVIREFQACRIQTSTTLKAPSAQPHEISFDCLLSLPVAALDEETKRTTQLTSSLVACLRRPAVFTPRLSAPLGGRARRFFGFGSVS
jgi:hypothetical protein